ncbi:MAG: gluconokinase [Spirosomataceae bacterium]
MNTWIGVDIGTTNVKATAIDEAGEVVAHASGTCVTYYPHQRYAEQDPDQIYRLFADVLRQVTDQLSYKNAKVEAVSLCSAMHSVIPLDARNRRLTRSLLWADNRSEAQADALKTDPIVRRLYPKVGIPPHPYAPLTKIVWFREKQPTLFQRISRFVSQKEYIWYRLFDKFQIDYSMASGTALLDNRRFQWSPLALEYAGISSSHLSDVVSGYHSEKLTKPSLCKALGLPSGTPFIIGAGDACLANLGSGALEKGVTTLTIGTSGAVRQTSATPARDARQRLFTYVLDKTHYVSGGPTNNGGNVLEWLSKHLLLKDSGELLALAENAPAGAEDLLFVPYLLGERAPVWNAHATGSYQQLCWQHTQAHLARATLEGVLMNLNQIRQIIDSQLHKTQILHANGGFTRSAFWVQLVADIFNTPVRVNESNESGCLGAVLMAMKSLGHIDTLENGVHQYVRFAGTYRPNPSKTRIYRKLQKVFEKAIESGYR